MPSERPHDHLHSKLAGGPGCVPEPPRHREHFGLVTTEIDARRLTGGCGTLSLTGQAARKARGAIQQFMMRLSSNLRRYRWAVFVVWVLLLVPSVYLALNHSDRLTGGGFEVEGSQSLQLQHQLEEQFPEQGASALALVAVPRADASFEDMNAAVAQLQRIAAEVPSVREVPNPRQPPPAPDRPFVVQLQLDFDNSGAVDIAKQLREKVGIEGERAGESENGKVRLYVIGQGALGAAAQQATKHDILQAEKWNVPVVLIILLAVFGSLAAAAMPLMLGVCTVVVTMGVVFLLSHVMAMSVFATSTVSMFGIAVAVDYSLFILMRYREELRAGRDSAQAIDAAMATSGLAVVLSGLTVIASVTGIYLIATPILQSMATGAILAVAVAVLTSTTLIPARAGHLLAGRRPNGPGYCTGRAGRTAPSRGSGPAG